ncbi:MAG TPA: ABC transporter ATP-binding protein [Pseudomonadota bacterium]|nr:ABC transporter ATP-binding protein [Pseudomonadota bacterium]
MASVSAATTMQAAHWQGHLRARDVGKVYAANEGPVTALESCSIDIPPRQFCALVGPSGCGKTTLLNAIAGFEALSSGEIMLDRRLVNSVRERLKPGPDRVVVFQNGSLFPWATVRENLVRGPIIRRRMTYREAQAQALALLDRVGLTDVASAYPGALSSGMRRRVEIVRALLSDPTVILLDEPFRGLDTASKASSHQCLLDLWEASPKTVLLITHDLDEALFLADRVVVMTTRPGRVKVEFSVDLPRPRLRSVLTSRMFLALKAQIIGAVHEEAVKAFIAGERELA